MLIIFSYKQIIINDNRVDKKSNFVGLVTKNLTLDI